ncbi:anti-sigma factor [Mesobacillus maritimus]|uniref:anti sigma factor C-terminal domain-containing protein n=1 Tax=Mesobacillus maritimus TaxID=1643336 RepID=UPI002040C62B|nr:anti sigma factor C-terminal domain-containing protein [Mesobacillus maritimus]MCM3670565.1 anti-sigma factor [Mesobacillus maritimus]
MNETNKHNKEKELDDLFSGNSKNNLTKVVKKAKRMTFLRNVAITLGVILLLSILLSYTWLSIMRNNEQQAIDDIVIFNRITDPNVELLGSQSESNGIFEGLLTFNRYKEVEGIPVNWSDDVFTYSLFGGVSRLVGDHAPIQIQDQKDGLIRYYDRETKQRMLHFYHPEIQYSQIRQDLRMIGDFSDDTLLEVGLSFNKAYTVEEVRGAIPDSLSLKWYWVDTYSDSEIKTTNQLEKTTELATEIYGFAEDPTDPKNSVKNFVSDVKMGLEREDGKYFGEFTRINNNLRGDSAVLSDADVKISGAVVTGTAVDVALLQDVEMVRASVLGVAVNSY